MPFQRSCLANWKLNAVHLFYRTQLYMNAKFLRYRGYGKLHWKKIKKLHSYQGIQLWGNVQERLFFARVWSRYLIGSLENFIMDLFRWKQFSCPAQRFYNDRIKYSFAIALYPSTLNISFVCGWKIHDRRIWDIVLVKYCWKQRARENVKNEYFHHITQFNYL